MITAKVRTAILRKVTANPNAKQVCEEINNEVGRVSYHTVLKVIKAAGIDLTEAASERMKRLHADPEFAARLAAGARERMTRQHADPEFAARQAAGARKSLKRLHADPEFAARHAAAASARLKRLHADPGYAAANRERMKRRRRDPEFAARQTAAASESMQRLHADPEFEAKRIAGIRKAKARRHNLRRVAAWPALSGTVRVSVDEWAEGLLARHCGQANECGLPPGITLELLESPQTANLVRRDSDLALRHGILEAGNLFASKISTIAGALYRGRGTSTPDIGRGTPWITHTEEQANYTSARWLDERIRASGGRIVLRAATLAMRMEAIRAGAGIGLLPCHAGDADPLLERLTDPLPELAADYWIIVHRDLRRAACVRAVMDWIRGIFDRHRDILAGTVCGPDGAVSPPLPAHSAAE